MIVETLMVVWKHIRQIFYVKFMLQTLCFSKESMVSWPRSRISRGADHNKTPPRIFITLNIQREDWNKVVYFLKNNNLISDISFCFKNNKVLFYSRQSSAYKIVLNFRYFITSIIKLWQSLKHSCVAKLSFSLIN